LYISSHCIFPFLFLPLISAWLVLSFLSLRCSLPSPLLWRTLVCILSFSPLFLRCSLLCCLPLLLFARTSRRCQSRLACFACFAFHWLSEPCCPQFSRVIGCKRRLDPLESRVRVGQQRIGGAAALLVVFTFRSSGLTTFSLTVESTRQSEIVSILALAAEPAFGSKPCQSPQSCSGGSGGRNPAPNSPQAVRIKSGSRRTQGSREVAARHALSVSLTHGQPAVTQVTASPSNLKRWNPMCVKIQRVPAVVVGD